MDPIESFLARMTESKNAKRAELAQLPFAEKIRILEQLNQRAQGLRVVRERINAKLIAAAPQPKAKPE